MPSPAPSSPGLRVGIPAAVALAAFLAFSPALGGEFLNWDDQKVLTSHEAWRGLGWDQVRWAFTTHHAGHYHPLTWLSFGLDHSLWGMNPRGYHLVNLLLHAINAMLVYFILLRLVRAPDRTLAFGLAAAAGALFFAIHPLRVESVAWITERRDVLSGAMLLATVLSWLKWTAGEGRKWYGIALAAFALSLLSKAWGITLPVVLLILDVVPLRRFVPGRRAALLVEKIPFALLAIVAGVAAFLAQDRAGAMDLIPDHTVMDRAMQSGYGLFFYPAKTVVPVALGPHYALTASFNPFEAKIVAGAALAVAVTVALILLRRRRPEWLAGWAIYAVSVAPVLGLTQAGAQLVADRYSYLSCLPFAAFASAGLVAGIARFGPRGPGVAAAVVLAALGIHAWTYTHVWKDSVTLWTLAIKRDPDNQTAWYNRGEAFIQRGKYPEAALDLTQAIELGSGHFGAHLNRGVTRLQGDLPGAIADFNEALRLDPNSPSALLNRGIAHLRMRNAGAGEADLTNAIRLNPNQHEAYVNRGMARLQRGEIAGATEDLDAATRLKPELPDAWYIRGSMRHESGDFLGAEADYAKALSVAPAGWAYRSRAEDLRTRARERRPLR